ncbi:MAG: hypothetical protein HYV26_18250 [Candidatus Hydrogenedentes bacterium]|nr:hypothetical protein [Candidatus Hydrogenedentota bacterium]
MVRFSAVLLALGVACAGCGPDQQTSSEQQVSSPEELMANFVGLAKEGPNNLDVVSAQAIAKRLRDSPAGLEPLLQLLADPDADPVAKVLLVISVSPLVKPDMAPRLIDLTQPGHEKTTRACATHLLGLLNTPEAQARMQELAKDGEHRVQTAALLIMGSRGDASVIEMMPELWVAPETTDDDRDQILLMLPEEHVRQHLAVYKDAMLNQNIEPKSRERLATLLGRVGDESVLEVLKKAGEDDPNPSVRIMAKGAADTIQARRQGQLAPTTSAEAPASAQETPESTPETVP